MQGRLPTDGHTLPSRRRADAGLLGLLGLLVFVGAGRALAETGATVQEAALLGGAAALEPDRAWMSADAAGDMLALCVHAAAVAGCAGVVGSGRGCGEVGDVLGHRVARPDAGDADI